MRSIFACASRIFLYAVLGRVRAGESLARSRATADVGSGSVAHAYSVRNDRTVRPITCSKTGVTTASDSRLYQLEGESKRDSRPTVEDVSELWVYRFWSDLGHKVLKVCVIHCSTNTILSGMNKWGGFPHTPCLAIYWRLHTDFNPLSARDKRQYF